MLNKVYFTIIMLLLSVVAIAQDNEEPQISREDAIAELSRAIDEAQVAYDTYGEVTTPGIRTALQTSIPAAKVMLSTVQSGGWLGERVGTETIVTTYTTLDNLAAGAAETPLHYREALQAIEHVREINVTGIGAIATTAKGAVDLSLNNDAINTALFTMRASLVALLNTVSIPEGTSLTGVLSNNSFETGDETGWFTIGTGTDTGSRLAQDYPTEGVDGDYLFNTSQMQVVLFKAPASMIMQPMVLLPKGTYSFEADMAGKSDCYLTVMTLALKDIPELQEKIYNEDGKLSVEAVTGMVKDLYSSVSGGDYTALLEYLQYLKYAKTTYSEALRPASNSAFERHSVEFTVDDAESLTVVFANAGGMVDLSSLLSIDLTSINISDIASIMQLMSVLKLDAFKADNFGLRYLMTPEAAGIKNTAEKTADHTLLYNIYGEHVDDSYKGIVISEGRKILRR